MAHGTFRNPGEWTCRDCLRASGRVDVPWAPRCNGATAPPRLKLLLLRLLLRCPRRKG